MSPWGVALSPLPYSPVTLSLTLRALIFVTEREVSFMWEPKERIREGACALRQLVFLGGKRRSPWP